MELNELDYFLPENLIAQTPIEPRDSSRLLVLDRYKDHITHRYFRDIIDYLHPGDLLIGNESRVMPARLYGRKSESGGKVEILLLHKTSERCWKALIGGARTRINTRIELKHDSLEKQELNITHGDIQCTVLEVGEKGERIIEFAEPIEPFLDQIGIMPLPPYIHQPLQNGERYQTVYAKTLGSAAAPTAGLHFTPELLLQLRGMGIKFGFCTLHIGLDTFRPITESRIEKHQIHREWCSLSTAVAAQINEAKISGRKVIAVGTTSVRVLETAAKYGILQTPTSQCPWQTVSPFEGFTDLYITPGYKFQVVDTLITNFHLPKSSLLALVMAFAGKEKIKDAYSDAIKEKYRFYSFGDAMLIL
jgi:S-adenosylmethionine:tRNA ribosyltransferase-isomerase